MEAIFEGYALVFSIPAIVGTIFFLLRMGMMLLGGIGDIDGFDADTDLDLDADGAGVGEDSTDAFTVLSLQSIAAFVMGFGWAGLGGWASFDGDLGLALLCGVIGGFILMWVLIWLLKTIYSLQNSGNITLARAVGHSGTVYVSIPESGQGQVRVVIGDRARILNATSDEGAIPTGTRIRVIATNDDNTVTVGNV